MLINISRNIVILLCLMVCAIDLRSESFYQSTDSIHNNDIDLPKDYETKVADLLNKWYNGYTIKGTNFGNETNMTDTLLQINDSTCISLLSKLPTVLKISFNDDVKKAISLFSQKRRILVSQMLLSGDLYFPEIEMVLNKYDIPLELKYLAVIESGLNPNIKSRSGAYGIWQFMLPTAKMYGLKINSLIDERLDYIKSTEAACKLLDNLYQTYGDWWLAMAAYNCGPRVVNKAIKKAGQDNNDFWNIYKYLPVETRRYIPLFIGMYFTMYYHKFLGIYPQDRVISLNTDTFLCTNIIKFSDLSKLSGICIDTIKFLNPQYIRNIIPGNIDNGCLVRLPVAGIEQLENIPIDSIKSDDLNIKILKNAHYAFGKEGHANKIYHKVKKGESLSSIAHKYKITVKKIKSLNKIKGNHIKQGQTIVINIV